MEEKALQDLICAKLSENFAVETKFLTRDYAEVEGAKSQAEMQVFKLKAKNCKPLTMSQFKAARLLSSSDEAKKLLKDILICGGCENVVGKQLYCQECERRFCEDCYNKIMYCEGKMCPCCKTKISALKPVKNMMLEQLTESVFFKCDVCDDSMTVSEAYIHFKQVCPQLEVTCSFNSAHTVKLNKLQQHLLACPSRNVVCLVCNTEVKLSDAHDQNACRVSGLEK